MPTASPIYASSGDGLARNSGSGTWSSLVTAGTGSLTSQFNPTQVAADVTSAAKTIDRAILCFDLTGLPANIEITAATLSIYGNGKSSAAGGAIGITSASPASQTSLATSDYGNVGSTEYATRLNFASASAAGYNDFALNQAGLDYLNTKLATYAGFAVRSSFDIDNSAPGTTVTSYLTFYTTDQAGTSNDPKLVVTYKFVKTGADALAWSDAAGRNSARSGAGALAWTDSAPMPTRARSGADALAWTDSAPIYRRSTAEVVVWDAGPNTTLNGAQTLGSTVTVASTTGFPSSGTIFAVDNTKSTQQQAVATYTGKTSTTFTGCSWTSLIGRSTYADGSLSFDNGVAITAPDAETHFPQITPLDTSSTPVLLITAQQHGGHSVLRGKLVWKKSYDGGVTWPDSGTIVSSPANGSAYGVFGHTLTRMKNGRLIALWYEHKMDYTAADSVAAFKTMLAYSDDQAVTWSTPVKVNLNFGYSNDDGTNSFASFCYTGPGANSTYGDLYFPTVGNSDGIQVHSSGEPYRWFNKLHKITDGGASGTATEVGTICTFAQAGNRANGEAAIAINSAGTWIAHLRVEPNVATDASDPTKRNRWQAESTDNGATWTNQRKVIDGFANAAVLNILPGGTMIATGSPVLATDYLQTATVLSYDGGATWVRTLKSEASDITYSIYNGSDLAVVINDPGTQVNAVFAYAQERSSQAGARTMFRWYVDPVRRGADTLAWTDSASSHMAAQSRTGADTLAWTDTVSTSTSGHTSIRTGADTLTWTDTSTRSTSTHSSYSRSGADTLTFTDGASRAYSSVNSRVRPFTAPLAVSSATSPLTVSYTTAPLVVSSATAPLSMETT